MERINWTDGPSSGLGSRLKKFEKRLSGSGVNNTSEPARALVPVAACRIARTEAQAHPSRDLRVEAVGGDIDPRVEGGIMVKDRVVDLRRKPLEVGKNHGLELPLGDSE